MAKEANRATKTIASVAMCAGELAKGVGGGCCRWRRAPRPGARPRPKLRPPSIADEWPASPPSRSSGFIPRSPLTFDWLAVSVAVGPPSLDCLQNSTACLRAEPLVVTLVCVPLVVPPIPTILLAPDVRQYGDMLEVQIDSLVPVIRWPFSAQGKGPINPDRGQRELATN